MIGPEVPTADITAETLFSGMYPLVTLDVLLRLEHFGTVFALEWALASVASFMTYQIHFGFQLFVAKRTNESSFLPLLMVQLMLFVIGFTLGNFPTNLAAVVELRVFIVVVVIVSHMSLNVLNPLGAFRAFKIRGMQPKVPMQRTQRSEFRRMGTFARTFLTNVRNHIGVHRKMNLQACLVLEVVLADVASRWVEIQSLYNGIFWFGLNYDLVWRGQFIRLQNKFRLLFDMTQ